MRAALADSKSRRLVMAIVFVALAVRVLVVAVSDYTPQNDAADYHRHGVSIASGEGYPVSVVASAGGPTAFRAPLYPYFIGGIYAVVGEKVGAVRYAQALIGTLSVVLIGLVALLIWGRGAGFVSLGLAAIYPPLVMSGADLLTEPIFLLLFLGAAVAVLFHRQRGEGYRWALLAGLLVGLATLARPNGFVLLLPLAMGIWVGRPAFSRRALGPPLAMTVVALLVVAPWTVRNAIVMNEAVPVSTQAGYTLAGTYNAISREDPEYPAAWRPPNLPYPDIFRPDSGLNEIETERELRSRALGYLSEHPTYIFTVGFWNTVRMLELNGFDWPPLVSQDIGISETSARWATVSFWIVGLLAIFGVFTRAGRLLPAFLWAAAVFLVVSVIFISGSTPRFRNPLEPYFLWFAALAALAAHGMLPKGRRDVANEPDR